MYDTPGGWGWNGFAQQPMPMQMPQQQQRPFSNMPAQRYEVIKVNGEAGAKNFRMAANSSALLLDETAPIVWYAQTDGTGYLTVTPFDIRPHQIPVPVDVNELSNRVAKLEDMIANVQQSYSGTSKQSKKQRQQQQSNECTANESSGNTAT